MRPGRPHLTFVSDEQAVLVAFERGTPALIAYMDLFCLVGVGGLRLLTYNRFYV